MTTLPLEVSKAKHIHMVAVCGTGMGSLAGMLKASGYRVTGSDEHIYPPMSAVLKDQGIECRNGFSEKNIDPDVDLVIIGNAVSRSNPEVQAVLSKQLPYLSLPQALSQFFLQGKKTVVITGTHGKTTTSSLIAWVLEAAGLNPGFMIGGFVKNFKGNYQLGKGPFFVVEGDEYDSAFFDKGPKFLHYRPMYSILTSIEFDHGDIYKDLRHIQQAFHQFIQLIPSEGMLMVSGEDSNIKEILGDCRCRLETYGLDGTYDWSARKIEASKEGLSFDVYYQGSQFGSFVTPLMGHYNLKNSLAVIGLSFHLKLTREDIQKGIETFQGVKRRQEIAGEVDHILVMDDFAHHPTAIKETLSGIKMRYPGRAIWVIFEPRSATSRRNFFQKEFSQSFNLASKVIISHPIGLEKIPPQERLDPAQLVRDIGLSGTEAFLYQNADEIVSRIVPKIQSGDLICVMSSGGFDGIHGKLLKALQNR
ncbi:MAG: UDP-N-acetylmuramate:L-alanyl-gamma-D-glutamyl-meso-diaminopimelate ligase [Nitrospirae bacterium]|nr:UDP-N-acetylmuramate:L-alanyl-gamma-D-glutamyl-meso-diaminopimelate ligase [Nitrospirota bacterium]MBI3351233.1 UDP-N-acetylmuramate:L-alanyl-gamma-D-glutamyl-meso-diaminopimelate ligase [Nitrospirota bacterium]